MPGICPFWDEGSLSTPCHSGQLGVTTNALLGVQPQDHLLPGDGADEAIRYYCSRGSWRRLLTSRPSTKIHQASVLAHHFCFSMVAGCGTNTSGIHWVMILSAECKHSGVPRGCTGAQTTLLC